MCGAVCRHADPEYDSDNDPLAYDGSLCSCGRCANFRACATWSRRELCTACVLDYGPRPLAEAGKRVCPVCQERAACYAHPAGCGHPVCGPCVAATVRHCALAPPPSDYGFARACGCDAREAVWGAATCSACATSLEAFEKTIAGAAWVEACLEADASTVACPLCRAQRRKDA